MTLQEKRKAEQKNVMDKRKSEAVTCAMLCFCKNGIETTAIADIAAFAQVGEATLYRYFTTKENLVMECGIWFWKLAISYYEKTIYTREYLLKNGMEQLETLLRITETIYREHRSKFKFLHDLDVFLLSHKVEEEKLKEYEALVDFLRPCLVEAIEKGKEDKSISFKEDTLTLYYTITHTVLSLMQKMAGMGQLLKSDTIVAEQAQISLLIKLLLEGIANNEQ